MDTNGTKSAYMGKFFKFYFVLSAICTTFAMLLTLNYGK